MTESSYVINQEYLDIETIKGAITGDTKSMLKVIDHYKPYIVRLSTKELYDKEGNIYHCFDEEMCKELENRMLEKMLKFKP